MKKYYIAQVQVIIDGRETIIVKISGMNFNPNAVKRSAINWARANHQGNNFATIILNKIHCDLKEYNKLMGANPSWLNGERN